MSATALRDDVDHESTDSPAARCIRTGRVVGDPSALIGGRLTPPRDPVALDALPLFERQLRGASLAGVLRAAAGAALIAAIGMIAWYVVRGWGLAGDILSAVLAVATGGALGLGVVFMSGKRHGARLSVVALAFTVVAMVLSSNFVQRDQLQQGIDTLQPRWETMREMAERAIAGADVDAEAETDQEAAGPGMIPEDAALQEDTLVGGILVPAGAVIPPPEIVRVLPTPAFDLMGPEVMAVVWPDIPEARKGEFDPELVAQVLALIEVAEAYEREHRAGSDLEGLTLSQAREIYAESNYDIPRPVLNCAPPPDLTQPNAAAGLGFPNGVPLFLPASDYYQDRGRGDGLEVERPSPWCFARENALAEPMEAVSWAVAGLLALLIPARRRLAVVRGGKKERTRYERLVGRD